VALPAHDGETLVFEVVDGLRSGPWRGFEVPIKGSVSGDVLRTGTSVMATDAMSAARAVQPDYAPPRGARVHGPLMVVPLGAGPLRGVLLLAREIGRLPFTDDELNLATSFAGHAALALEHARARTDRAMLAVYEDRDRIARDLHDLVIQRVFATGLQLHGLRRGLEEPLAGSILKCIRDLDATIRDIRSTIFDLQPPTAGGALADVRALVDDAARTLGVAPTLRLAGAAEHGLPDAVRPHLLAVLREALTNVARHARATEVEVFLEIGEDVRLAVRDNGIGLPKTHGRAQRDAVDARARGAARRPVQRPARPGGGHVGRVAGARPRALAGQSRSRRRTNRTSAARIPQKRPSRPS
jgi:signal transduction histidine kinase